MAFSGVITICGRPGSGKTTIGGMLAQKMGLNFIPERYEDCPYLPLFLSGQGYLKETELWFIKKDHDRYLKAFELSENGVGVVVDKPLIQNYEMIMATEGFNSQSEQDYCRRTLLETLIPLRKPHLLIDITIGKSLLQDSINTRGREMESTMTLADEQMQTQLHHHEAILRRLYDKVPRIIINRNTEDFLTDPTALTRLHQAVLSNLT